MATEPEGEPLTGPRPGRLLLVLMLLVVLGLPMMVITQLVQSRGVGPATRGAQPGGSIRGDLVDPSGKPLEGVPVEVFLVEGESIDEPVTRTTTSADGSFVATVSAVEGCYLVKVGGGSWRLDTAEFSFLDRAGEELEEVPDLDFEMHPGCTLVVRMERSKGRPVRGGKAELRGTWRPSSLLSLVPLQVVRREEFSGGELVMDGLPPLSGVVNVQFSGGDQLDFEIKLPEAGDQQRLEFVLDQ